MKTTINTFLMLAIISFAISCGNPSESKHEQSEAENTDIHQHDSESVVSLDNGKRWKANMETTIGINNMISLMESFSDKENIVAYATLKVNLDNEVNTILDNCKMTGESHNQLHNYLVPLIEMLREVGSSDIDTCKYGFMKLEKHLREYSTYFE